MTLKVIKVYYVSTEGGGEVLLIFDDMGPGVEMVVTSAIVIYYFRID